MPSSNGSTIVSLDEPIIGNLSTLLKNLPNSSPVDTNNGVDGVNVATVLTGNLLSIVSLPSSDK